MARKDENEILGYADCACGCGEKLILRRRHYYPSHLSQFPRFIKGHQQYGNKRGWKTGEIKESNGYVWVYSPYHPNKNAQGKGYVKRSRLIMEKKLGRYLTKYEVVHHINGIRDDDRIENLVLTTNRKHLSTYHKESYSNRLRDPKNGRFMKEVMPYA